MKYKPGDRVRIVDKRNEFCFWNYNSERDRWLGKVMTVRLVGDGFYYMEEDKDDPDESFGWRWYEGAVAGLAEEEKIEGIGADAPLMENQYGGKQSATPYGFHLLPLHAMFAAAQTAKIGADKYGEIFSDRNYTKVPPEEHVNHAIQHLYAFLAGDAQDDHLAHAIVRAMFAYETDRKRKEGKNCLSD